MPDLSTCAVHCFTTKPWSLKQSCEAYAAAGIAGVSVWRQHLQAVGTEEAENHSGNWPSCASIRAVVYWF